MDNSKQARKSRSYASLKLCPLTRLLTGVRCRATSVAKFFWKDKHVARSFLCMYRKDFFSPVAAVKVFLFKHPRPLPLKKCPHWPRFCVVLYMQTFPKHFQTFPKYFQKFSKIFAPPLQKCCPRVTPYTQTFSWCQPGKSKNLAYQTTTIFFVFS